MTNFHGNIWHSKVSDNNVKSQSGGIQCLRQRHVNGLMNWDIFHSTLKHTKLPNIRSHKHSANEFLSLSLACRIRGKCVSSSRELFTTLVRYACSVVKTCAVTTNRRPPPLDNSGTHPNFSHSAPENNYRQHCYVSDEHLQIHFEIAIP